MIINNIRKIREQKGWSQPDLARESHVSRSIISMVETGCYMLDQDALERIALALEVNIQSLYAPEVMAAVYGIGKKKAKRQSVKTVNVRISEKMARILDWICRVEQIGSRDEAARLAIRIGIKELRGREIDEPDNEQS